MTLPFPILHDTEKVHSHILLMGMEDMRNMVVDNMGGQIGKDYQLILKQTQQQTVIHRIKKNVDLGIGDRY